MRKTSVTDKPASSSKRNCLKESSGASPMKMQFESNMWDMLLSINVKLSSFDSRLSHLHREFQDIKDSLEFS